MRNSFKKFIKGLVREEVQLLYAEILDVVGSESVVLMGELEKFN